MINLPITTNQTIQNFTPTRITNPTTVQNITPTNPTTIHGVSSTNSQNSQQIPQYRALSSNSNQIFPITTNPTVQIVTPINPTTIQNITPTNIQNSQQNHSNNDISQTEELDEEDKKRKRKKTEEIINMNINVQEYQYKGQHATSSSIKNLDSINVSFKNIEEFKNQVWDLCKNKIKSKNGILLDLKNYSDYIDVYDVVKKKADNLGALTINKIQNYFTKVNLFRSSFNNFMCITSFI